MWAKLDDALLDHRKIFAAGKVIGTNGPAIALGFYTLGLLWSNKHLTDGVIPVEVIEGFRHVTDPIAVAEALVEAGLFRRMANNYQIHDFHEYNPRASQVKRHRAHVSAERAKAGLNGAKSRWKR